MEEWFDELPELVLENVFPSADVVEELEEIGLCEEDSTTGEVHEYVIDIGNKDELEGTKKDESLDVGGVSSNHMLEVAEESEGTLEKATT